MALWCRHHLLLFVPCIIFKGCLASYFVMQEGKTCHTRWETVTQQSEAAHKSCFTCQHYGGLADLTQSQFLSSLPSSPTIPTFHYGGHSYAKQTKQLIFTFRSHKCIFQCLSWLQRWDISGHRGSSGKIYLLTNCELVNGTSESWTLCRDGSIRDIPDTSPQSVQIELVSRCLIATLAFFFNLWFTP